MLDLVTVPIKAALTPIEEFLIDNLQEYGIIAGGFPAYLYNHEKKHTDIDLFVDAKLDSDIYDRIYSKLCGELSFHQKLSWRIESKPPHLLHYDSTTGLQELIVYDWRKKGTPDWHVHLSVVSRNNGDDRHKSAESIMGSFDWNVCRASVLDKKTLLVDRHFIEDMDTNRCTFRPYPPRKTDNNDYGWRLYKYVELKGYDMSFGDMLTIFGLANDKLKFFGQINSNGDVPKNKNLANLINFIKMMKNTDPQWVSGRV